MRWLLGTGQGHRHAGSADRRLQGRGEGQCRRRLDRHGSLPAAIVSNAMRNIPEQGMASWDWGYMSRYHPEQFYSPRAARRTRPAGPASPLLLSAGTTRMGFARRLMMVPTLIVIHHLLVIIQLPPGDYSAHTSLGGVAGLTVDQATIDPALRAQRADLGAVLQVAGQYPVRRQFRYSFEWRLLVSQLIAERLPTTFLVAICSLLFAWSIALPIGIWR